MDREPVSDLLEDMADGGSSTGSSGLEAQLAHLQEKLGHGHPDVLVLEEKLAHNYLANGDLVRARKGFEEVLVYRAVLDGEHGLATAGVARDLFRLLSAEGDRPGMAEVYYRFLSWIPMRDPATLAPELRVVLRDVEAILAESC